MQDSVDYFHLTGVEHLLENTQRRFEVSSRLVVALVNFDED
jgi:hypothetical protein